MENIKTRSTQFDPLNNFLFYKTFGENGDDVQLLGFINAVLGKTGDDKVTSLEILENKNFMAEIMGGKSCVLDVRAKLQNETMVNIEVQLCNQYNMDRRSLFYMSKVYTKELQAGQDYRQLPDIIAINIVDFNFPAASNFHSCFHLREDTEHGIILTNAVEIHFINMVKYRRQVRKQGKEKLNDPLYRWLMWLNKNSPPELLEEVIKMDTAIQTADKRLTHVTQSEEDMWAYTRYMMAECDRTGQLEYALGERDKKIARNALAEGSTPEFVHKITGLDLETIKNLKDFEEEE